MTQFSALSANQVSLTGASLGGSASAPIQVDASGGLSISATQGDAYVRNTHAASHDLLGAQAVGTVRYETATGVGFAVKGDVRANRVELVSGGNLDIGNAGAPVEISGSGSVELSGGTINLSGGSTAGASSSVKSSGGINVNATGDFVIQGGSGSNAFATVEVLGNARAVVTGAVRVLGGTGQGAYAKLDPAVGSSLDVSAAAIAVQGGAGNDAFATIVSDGDIVLDAPSLSLQAGTGSNAHGVVLSNSGDVTLPNDCKGCAVLNRSPLGDGVSVAGVFVGAALQPAVEQTSPVGAQLAQIAQALDAVLAPVDEKDKEPAKPDIVVEGDVCR
jgi:hypothetical protein